MKGYLVCNHDESDEHFYICTSNDEMRGLLIELNIAAQKNYCEEEDLDLEDFDIDNPCLEGAEISVYKMNEVIKAIEISNNLDAEEKAEYKKLLSENEEIEADNELLEIIEEIDEYYVD
ncbi:hypothetical protein QTL86_06280 [Cellulosilyticum sp. ST5]|uniref:hypothetical protein n=1 Tax=Cellulosilyticum sp. ST5 TaxID=3055805 RepID=UPI0039778E4B